MIVWYQIIHASTIHNLKVKTCTVNTLTFSSYVIIIEQYKTVAHYQIFPSKIINGLI